MGHKLPGKKSSIVTPQDHWPSVLHCGVGMVASSAADGRPGVYYELRYTDEYRQGQQLFAAMAATHDPQNLVDVLHQHPYQLDTLLQMSQIYAQMGEQQQAADLLERAVYCLEQASHPAFIAGLGGAAEGGGWIAARLCSGGKSGVLPRNVPSNASGREARQQPRCL